jgi:hypothetical protein
MSGPTPNDVTYVNLLPPLAYLIATIAGVPNGYDIVYVCE